MPTYAYACKDCDHAFDIHQSFSEDSLTSCPECDGSLRKKFNSVGVVFKGSGFYRNDSRDAKTSTSAAKKDSGSTNGSGTTDAGSNGSKSADSGSGSSTSGSGDSSSSGSSSTPVGAGAGSAKSASS
ncbi:FmdB family zinc ribbon protein [Arthrobacter sp. H14]|uniref:FmdB family zinc ribbon protein n=1 Tax=Arthrobacter sp. H14 TaxID=1312959 RepID=UPI00047DD16C|nr:FmdB family zinc ribbon protein [Arthrobacter sp. H14]